ncbi:redox protein [Solibacillus silvestris]|uniref:redox protein n=1 Tax=Solibacillus silvestris TaxID=76853 RepID=UPI003F7F6980
MEPKKVDINCRNCHEQMTIDFATDNFSSEIQLLNGKKQQKRTYIKKCPYCETINHITSNKKEEWGNRKGPNIKLFLFSGMFSCLAFAVIGLLFIYFAFKGFGFVVDWLFN